MTDILIELLVRCHKTEPNSIWGREKNNKCLKSLNFLNEELLYRDYTLTSILILFVMIVMFWILYLPAFISYHHVVPLAWISLTLSRHFSLSFFASGRSSGLHPVSSHSCCMYVRAGHPAFAWPYAGVHRSTSIMSSSLLL